MRTFLICVMCCPAKVFCICASHHKNRALWVAHSQSTYSLGCPFYLQRALLSVGGSIQKWDTDSLCCVAVGLLLGHGEEWSYKIQRAKVKASVKHNGKCPFHCLWFPYCAFLTLKGFVSVLVLLFPSLFQPTCQPVRIQQMHTSSASGIGIGLYKSASVVGEQKCVRRWKHL